MIKTGKIFSESSLHLEIDNVKILRRSKRLMPSPASSLDCQGLAIRPYDIGMIAVDNGWYCIGCVPDTRRLLGRLLQ